MRDKGERDVLPENLSAIPPIFGPPSIKNTLMRFARASVGVFVGASSAAWGWAAVAADAAERHRDFVQAASSAQQTRMGVTSQLLFSPGSADDIISQTLCSGDVLLFSRRSTEPWASRMGPASTALSLACSGGRFDHCALIVIRGDGLPCVLEHTRSGVQLRRFDARVRLFIE